jgi:hypothetical protein
MRNFIRLIPVILLAVCMYACMEDAAPPVKNEKVQFTFQPSSTTSDGGRSARTLPDGISLRISISDRSGNAVVTDQTITILKMGESYMTEPLELRPGSYMITDFLIVKDSEVLFATPKHGSPLAPAVEHSLPYGFSVGKNAVTNVQMQVIDVAGEQPEAFGYASFGIALANPFQISVFIQQDGKMVLTEANASIFHDTTRIKTYSLKAKTNLISFPGDPDDMYTLKIEKPGYENYSYIKEFTYTGLMDELAGQPLKVTLTPALVLDMVHATMFEIDPVRLHIMGEGVITISGLGSKSGTYTLPVLMKDVFEDSSYGEYSEIHSTVTIRGDLAGITDIDCFGYNGGIVTFSGFELLPELQSFSPGIKFNDQADFTHNTKLQMIDLFWAQLPEWIVLPNRHYIKSFTVATADVFITSEQIDAVVSNLYNNTSHRNIRNGGIYMQNTEEPSDAAKSQIDQLRMDYGWNINIQVHDDWPVEIQVPE